MHASVDLLPDGHIVRHVAKGGSEGADEPPFSSDQKKKKIDGVRVWQLRGQVRSRLRCTAVGLRIHGPEPNLESVAV